MGPDFDQNALDEFDDIKTKVDDELKMQPFEVMSRRPREITIYLGNTGPHTIPTSRVSKEVSVFLALAGS